MRELTTDDTDDWERVGVAAALAKQYADDERDFLVVLASMLEAALPAETRVDRGGWFGKKAIRRISVAFPDFTYAVCDTGRGPLEASRARIVRGVALKTEPLPVPDWIAMLSAAIEARAATSQAARDALARLAGEA